MYVLMEGFRLESNPIWLMTPKTSTLPKKSQHKYPSWRGSIFHPPINVFLFEKHERTFSVALQFAEMVYELAHRMEEIIAQENPLTPGKKKR
jgi:hypothetical protein